MESFKKSERGGVGVVKIIANRYSSLSQLWIIMKRMIAITGLAIVFTLFFSLQLICGDVYKWVDENGTTHFTDSYSSIPEKYIHQIEKQILPDKIVDEKEEIIKSDSAKYKKKEETKRPKSEARVVKRCRVIRMPKSVGSFAGICSIDDKPNCLRFQVENFSSSPLILTERNIVVISEEGLIIPTPKCQFRIPPGKGIASRICFKEKLPQIKEIQVE